MSRMIVRLGLAAAALTFGLGAEMRFMDAEALARSTSTPSALEQEIAMQVEQRQPVIKLAYTGDRAELSANIAELARRAIEADDYTAYVVDAYFYSVRAWGSTATVTMNVRYRESAEQTRYVDEQVRQTLAAIVTPAMNDSEKVRAIHDWIVLRLAYDENLARYTAYEALTEGKAVCQGYALLNQRMLTEAGIESRIVEGQVDSGSHVWNLVRLEDGWHHVDATWDDPLPDKPGHAGSKYLLRSDAEMRKDHRWEKAYPAAGEAEAGTAAGREDEPAS
ncbi:transglutaminase domain-containing protein [Paenibacillus methanolicus]|uniref:Transglutaminase superfamily protein n=1 Tax=Paenibacillus methanolicus TaxID=582686 RepID=A0A5S5BRZ7_9BACL|nr:transglutaminase domain-containing protein [Paenibacillus methanolicus]TYP69694.1 transglutaminase superfamily protein [Paenibacillus methanolicus]